MQFSPLPLPGLLLIEPRVFADGRGHFFESYQQNMLDEAVGRPVRFIQHNRSFSRRGVVRGLHYQIGAAAQGKLVQAVAGSVFDVAVDLRRSSPGFGKWHGVVLSAENRQMLWIPEGFAHGFLALTEGAALLYCATTAWAPEMERSIVWNDPDIGIAWPLGEMTPVLSGKDAAAGPFAGAEVFA